MIKQFYLTHSCDPIGTTTPSQSGPGSNGNKGVLHIFQGSRTRALLADRV